MFSSLKTKSIFFITLIMLTTLFGVIYFTQRDVGDAMVEAEKASAQNVLRLVELNIKGEYNKLLSDKIDMIVRIQRQLKSITSHCKSVLEAYYALSMEGALSEHKAVDESLKWLKTVNYEKGEVLLFDRNGTVLVHPDPAVQGGSLGELEDNKGRNIVKVMDPDALKEDGDFAVFTWIDREQKIARKKLGCFVPFPKWQWTLGVVIGFDNIEAESEKRMQKIIEVLGSTFSSIHIAKSGFAFLFNGNRDILIAPHEEKIKGYRHIRNTLSGNLLLDDLMQAARRKQILSYGIVTSKGLERMEAHVSYFKAFNWYIVVTVPVKEILEPATSLVTRQSLIIAMIFLGSMIIAYFLMSSFSRPLNILAAYAKQLPSHDFTAPEETESPIKDLPLKYKDEVGRLAESFVFMENELKKNIQEVIEAEAKYRSILQNIEEGFFETDLSARLTFFNDSVCKMTGYDREELLRMGHRTYTSRNSYRRMREVLKRVYRTGEPAEVREFGVIRKDGLLRTFELSLYLVRDQGGNPIGFRGVARDISDRLTAEREKKRLEAKLLQAQKMEAIGTLAGGVAHDFNNVLSIVMGYAELAIIDSSEDSRTRRNLNEVLEASKRARELVKQILTFSRHSDQELKPVKISLIIKETIKFLRATLPATIEIREKILTNSDMILSDPTRIHQILMNLCTNAFHAMHDSGGVLEVTLSDVQLDAAAARQYATLNPGRYVKLTVSDTGHGMQSAVLERIFDPYFTTKDVGTGTGLGLAVVHGIVRSHGGVITVRSEVGKGSSFDIFLPFFDKIISTKTKSVLQFPGGNERVLFVDDEPILTDLGKRVLTLLGYKVRTCASGAEALEVFIAQPQEFDLVISDMTMPGITGATLAKRILEVRPDIPIVICTGYSDQIDEQKARALGVREYIMKPLLAEELAHVVRRAIEGRAAESTEAEDSLVAGLHQ